MKGTPIGIQEAQPWTFPVTEYHGIVDFIYTWQMAADSPISGSLEEHYEEVASANGGSLWVRK